MRLSAILIISLLFYSYSTLIASPLTYSVGSSCLPNPIYNITNVDIEPWPITTSQNSYVNITGVLLSNQTILFIQYGLRLQATWNYQKQTLGGNYTAGPQNFPYMLIIPQYSGNYFVQITVTNSAYQILACWSFNFSD